MDNKMRLKTKRIVQINFKCAEYLGNIRLCGEDALLGECKSLIVDFQG